MAGVKHVKFMGAKPSFKHHQKASMPKASNQGLVLLPVGIGMLFA
jgi:hypothetical protein